MRTLFNRKAGKKIGAIVLSLSMPFIAACSSTKTIGNFKTETTEFGPIKKTSTEYQERHGYRSVLNTAAGNKAHPDAAKLANDTLCDQTHWIGEQRRTQDSLHDALAEPEKKLCITQPAAVKGSKGVKASAGAPRPASQ